MNGIVRFLGKAELLNVDAAKAALKLGEMRNQYAHARGQNPEDDAIKAIKLLHVLIEDTVSVFKEFELEAGALTPKKRQSCPFFYRLRFKTPPGRELLCVQRRFLTTYRKAGESRENFPAASDI